MKLDTENIALSHSSIGTRRHITVFRFGRGRTGPKIYLQGGLHADEPPGMLILHHLVRLLQKRDDEPNGEIIIVPCANPIGLSQRFQGHIAGRSDLGVGGNFNRNFPDVSNLFREQLSLLRSEDYAMDEQAVRLALRRAVAALTSKTELDSMKQALLSLAIDADYVLDVHCDDGEVVYAFVSDPDHPDVSLLSSHIGSVATMGGWVEAVTFPGSCYRPWRAARELLPGGSTTRRLAATLEYRGTRDVSDDVAIEDALGLMGFMEAVGILEPKGKVPQDTSTLHTTLECIDYVEAHAHGVILFQRRLARRWWLARRSRKFSTLRAVSGVSSKLALPELCSGVPEVG
ncbi:succinylglutamate desuccinylase/aspartoacylase family protein (plasmid) [Microvirga sp. RSM25]|uniref:M14 family zinc carboxypeptidase n=1 Tax=Microvirga sp. RSM25 TaxID=3273802 RepID=UPI00384EF182